MIQIGRRHFLKSAAAAAGAIGFPTIVPAAALGRGGATAPSERIAMACIGVGSKGTDNLNQFLRFDDVQVVALCDVCEEASSYVGGKTRGLRPALRILEEYYAQNTPSGRYKGCAAYSDFRDALARDDIDAIAIGTPDHWHALISIAAAESGKDIYCEKPLANTIPEGRAVCQAIERNGRVLQTGSHEQSRDSVRFACELVRNGRIGKLHTVRVNMPVDNHGPIDPQPEMPIPPGFDYDMWLGPCPWAPYTEKRCHFSFRYILDYSGGEITDRGAHIIDLVQLGCDTSRTGPVRISGSGWAPEDGLFNTFMKYNFEFEYASGVKVIGQSEAPRGLKFEGTEGSIFIHIHGGMLETDPESLVRETIGPDEIHLGRSPGHHRDFINAVKTRRQPMAPAEYGHRTVSICHLINAALLMERPMVWDPVAEKVVGDPEADRLLHRPMRSPWRI